MNLQLVLCFGSFDHVRVGYRQYEIQFFVRIFNMDWSVNTDIFAGAARNGFRHTLRLFIAIHGTHCRPIRTPIVLFLSPGPRVQMKRKMHHVPSGFLHPEVASVFGEDVFWQFTVIFDNFEWQLVFTSNFVWKA